MGMVVTVETQLKDNITSYEWKMKKRKSDALNEDELSYKIRISDVNVVITGYSKDYSSYLSKETLKLGGQLVGMGVHCTHLVAPKILRTVKFLTCVSHASYVVTSQWLENSIAASQFLDPCSFLLKDEEVEQKLNFDFQKNIKHRSSGKLFQGLQMYMTPNISPPVSFLRELVKCHGGQVITHPPDAVHPAPSLIIITCEKDVHLLADALKTNLYNSEFLINAIIKQQVDFSTFGGI
ncbi:hypothetical protein HELRODRAFT_191367 [Helobdella robusta]|uniref:PAX-interacting protein 1 n=1 Tax=Helobdella robusta TaxID=6412 RepID=T1FSX4_HELRO|nr:hypothetical protein HELRODRAFT_191367 [Helobdella robusta]ESO05728.1 hypothetical protein HELRODRAFT_191367 [Helobdella robusta]